MKDRMRRAFSMLLCAAAAGALALAEPAYALTYSEFQSRSVDINDQLTLTQAVRRAAGGGDNVVENYFEYLPGEGVVPLVCYGSDVAGAASVSRVYKLESEAGNRIVGLTNGDFFVLATGVSLGPVIRDGTVRTGGYSESVVAFDPGGGVYFGDPSLNIALTLADSGRAFQKINFNKTVNDSNGICVFTDDYSPTNGAYTDTFNVAVSVDSGEARLGSSLEGTVVSSFHTSAKTPLSEGMFLISIAENTPYVNTRYALEALQPGERISLSFSASEQFLGVENALGFERWLVRDGYEVSGLNESDKAPRTACGVRQDGRFVLYTADGRQPGYSAGLSLAELATRMRQLGCVQAVNLDGGASTQLFTTLPGEDSYRQMNVDSNLAGLRACGNYICFINRNEPDGTAANLHLYPYDEYVLAGSVLEMEVKATDAGYYAAAVPRSVSYSCEGPGSMEGGSFRAGFSEGTATVTARAGKAEGSTRVRVVGRCDSLTLSADGKAVSSELAVSERSSVQFGARAVLGGRELYSSPECYTWKVYGDIGTVDEKGLFTAALGPEISGTSASGSISVSAGGQTVTVPVSVKRTIPTDGLQMWIREMAERSSSR